MAEYIEKDGLYRELAHLEELARSRYLNAPLSSPSKDIYRAQMNERTMLKHIVADTPAENVAPVSSAARWEWVEDFEGDGHWRCTNCGVEWFFADGGPEENEAHYCPRCGALMDME